VKNGTGSAVVPQVRHRTRDDRILKNKPCLRFRWDTTRTCDVKITQQTSRLLTSSRGSLLPVFTIGIDVPGVSEPSPEVADVDHPKQNPSPLPTLTHTDSKNYGTA
jgi:hypothetical protein